MKSIDGNDIKNPVAYCRCHKGHLSLKQMQLHRCTSRNCISLVKMDVPYWQERQRIKEEKKERRRQYAQMPLRPGT